MRHIPVNDCYSCPNKAERRDWCNVVGGIVKPTGVRKDCPLPVYDSGKIIEVPYPVEVEEDV